MKSVSVREMRDHIGTVLEEAERGESLVIKRHGREIAKLGPMDTEQEGLPSMAMFRDSIKCKGNTLSQDIVEARMQERF